MFKRDARDKVRQMGGIMASSEPLIQEVARFQYGGGVKGYLNGVQVVELVEYSTDDFDVVPGGYVNQEASDIPFGN